MGYRRRMAWPGGILVGILALIAAAAQAAVEDPTVTIFAGRDPQLSTQLAVGIEAGIFKKHGLSPQIQWQVTSVDLPNMIASGQLNVFVPSHVQMAILRGQGYPVYWVVTHTDVSGAQAFMLGPTGAAKVREPKDIERLKIGALTGSNTAILLENAGRLFGFDPTKAQYVNIGPPENVTALAKGDIDAMGGWEPWLTNAVKSAPGARVYLSGSRSFIPGREGPAKIMPHHTGLGVIKRYIEKNPETVRALVRAIVEATDYINQDLERAIGMVSKQMRIPVETLRETMPKNVYTAAVDRDTVEAARQFVDYFYKIKRIPKAPDPETFFYTKFLAEVDPALAKFSANEMR